MADTAPEDVEKRALLAFLDAQRAIVLAIVAGWAEDGFARTSKYRDLH